jgi:hypothetical protein
MSDSWFMCRDCYTMVSWRTAKSGKKYLAVETTWLGDFGGIKSWYPSHSCTPNPERQAQYAAEQAEREAARAAALGAKAEREARREALLEAGVTVPEGRATVTGVIVSIKAQETYYTYSGEITLKMLIETTDGFRLWGTMPRSLEGNYNTVSAEEGDTVTFTATLTASDDDPLFGFFKRPTKASIVARASASV